MDDSKNKIFHRRKKVHFNMEIAAQKAFADNFFFFFILMGGEKNGELKPTLELCMSISLKSFSSGL